MYSERLEGLIEAALADGKIEEKEMLAICRVASQEGIGLDEIETYVNAKLYKMKQEQKKVVETEANKNKMGNWMKCPSCGATVLHGSASCPECGYAFNKDAATDSAAKLIDMLQQLNMQDLKNRGKESSSGNIFLKGLAEQANQMYNQEALVKAKMNLISNFPVPNTRADLLNFLTMIQVKANKNGSKSGGIKQQAEDLSRAYWELFTNCIMKAKISFRNDADFQYFFQYYDQQLNTPNIDIDKRQSLKVFLILISALVGCLFLVWLLETCS